MEYALRPDQSPNALLAQVFCTPERRPFPQLTHMSVPLHINHRLLPEIGSGYAAPKFEGKEQQLKEGMFLRRPDVPGMLN